ncbi:ECF transporter S component [bacterium]|nr:ECF transporter S component [bacterium]
MFIAIGLVLPFITGQIPQVGKMLLPMHIPVFLCGFICGWRAGLTVGFILPLLRGLLFGMPALMPMGASMAFELAAYGFIAGFMYPRLSFRTPVSVLLTTIAAMIGGRIAYGAAAWLFWRLQGDAFTARIFLAGAFLQAIPGIIIQLILFPALITALEKAHMLDKAAVCQAGK